MSGMVTLAHGDWWVYGSVFACCNRINTADSLLVATCSDITAGETGGREGDGRGLQVHSQCLLTVDLLWC